MTYILDTTIVIQRLVREVHTDNVRILFNTLRDDERLIVPEFCLVECVNVIWKQVRFQNMPDSQAISLITNLTALPLTIVPASRYLSQSLTIGLRHQLAIYDSIYLVMAKEFGQPLITEDFKQAKAAESEEIVLKAITDFIATEDDEDGTA